jgi:GNAT superfamily N-acetyltransferase
VGIYGVATIPAERKRGLGTLLLGRIAQAARETELGLQVETGSYAHRYYEKLGFVNGYALHRLKPA